MFDAKRLIGREFRDHNVQQDLKHWPFKVVDVGDKPKIQVEFKSEEKTFTPEEISSMVSLRTYVIGKGGIMSEDTGRFLLLQKNIFQISILSRKFKFPIHNSKQLTYSNFLLRIAIWNIYFGEEKIFQPIAHRFGHFEYRISSYIFLP